MKPKEYPYPFLKKEILLQDRVWAIPGVEGEDTSFHFPGWESPLLFSNSGPVHIEYCSGNGLWIAERAKRDTHINWLGVEMKFDRIRKIWSKIKNGGLSNLVALYGEGLHATKRYIPHSSVDAVYVNFPDPWPKRRHAKNRVIEPSFVDELTRILKCEGVLTLVTDDKEYSKQMITTVLQNPLFASLHPAPFYVTELEGYGNSSFEALWRGKGKTIHFHQFIRLARKGE